MNHQLAFTAPHAKAAETGLAILEQGGSAVEAMVAAAAKICVVYPHMTGIGGDAFWLIDTPRQAPRAINAAGHAGEKAATYPETHRGGTTALTTAGTVRGWQIALDKDPYRQLPLETLLAPAIDLAKKGFTISESLATASSKVLAEGGYNQAFIDQFTDAGNPLLVGNTFKNPELATTFETLVKKGLETFYDGSIAKQSIKSLQAAGSPLTCADLEQTQATWITPLSVALADATLYNLPAPTQGISSLMILALVDHLKHQVKNEAGWVHLILEATKLSFRYRDSHISDPSTTPQDYAEVLAPESIATLADQIDMQQAAPWPHHAETGDTVWMGAVDRHGQMVSFIQSIYHEFGSAVAIEDAGFIWHNRALGFHSDPTHPNGLAPGKQPRHTLNPALALFNDGRKLVYGTMGGEGQPQTQAAIFSRFAWQEKRLTEAIGDARWLLGRTWGDAATDLTLEKALGERIGKALTDKGHHYREVANLSEMMGHAGAIATNNHNIIDCASDPRSDGVALIG